MLITSDSCILYPRPYYPPCPWPPLAPWYDPWYDPWYYPRYYPRYVPVPVPIPVPVPVPQVVTIPIPQLPAGKTEINIKIEIDVKHKALTKTKSNRW